MSIVCLVRQNAILLSFDILKLQYLGFEILCFFPIWREPSLQSQLEKLRSIFHCPLNEITPSIHWSVFWVCSLPMVFDHCHFTNDLAKPSLQWTTMYCNDALQWFTAEPDCGRGRETTSWSKHWHSLSISNQHLELSLCTRYMGLVKM